MGPHLGRICRPRRLLGADRHQEGWCTPQTIRHDIRAQRIFRLRERPGDCAVAHRQSARGGASVTENAQAFGFLLFLFYLGIVTFALTRQAVQTVRTRRDPDSIRTPFHLVVGIAPTVGSVMVLTWALTFWSSFSVVMLAFAPLGVLISSTILKYSYRRPPEKRAWFYAHMGALLGAGIAFHTAFLVFGSRALSDLSLFGSFNWVPWILPALIGVPGGRYWEAHYRRKFGDLADAGADKATAPA